MRNSNTYAADLLASVKKIEQMREDVKVLFSTDYLYRLETVSQRYLDLFDRFCPFKIGDLVKLTATPEISSTVSPGYLRAKHFLIEGAFATIVSRDYNKGSFVFGLVFDNESWICPIDKEIHPIPPEDRHIYLVGEQKLTLISSLPPSEQCLPPLL